MTRARFMDDDTEQWSDVQRRLKRLELGPRISSVSSSLPATALDGEEVVVYDATAGPTNVPLDWHFRYHAGFTWPWIFMGGPNLNDIDSSSETRGPTGTPHPTFFALTNPVELALPWAGFYDIVVGAWIHCSNAVAVEFRLRPFLDTVATALAPLDSSITLEAGGEWQIWEQTARVQTTAAGTLIQGFSLGNTTGAVTIARKWLFARPVRVQT